MDIKLALMTGVDIPIPELQSTIHQPTLLEISHIGTQDFLIGIQTLCISKLSLVFQGNSVLENTTNFQIFMAIMQEKETQDKKENVKTLFQLIFPNFQTMITPQSILLSNGDITNVIDENNFEIFQNYLREIFCVNRGDGQQSFNPADAKAKEIAEKLMRARQRVAAQKGGEEGDPFAKYISILAIALHISPKDLIGLTMYQLYDLVERYELWLNWDLDVRSRLAGGKPDGKPEDWMKNIH